MPTEYQNGKTVVVNPAPTETRTPVTGILGTIFGATALAGVLSQNNGGGILGGLFGNNGNNGNNGNGGVNLSVYQQQKVDEGQKASTELDMYMKFIKPLEARVCETEKQDAVSAATLPFVVQLLQANIKEATCDCIRGKNLLNINQVAETYHGGCNEVVTRHHSPFFYPRPFGGYPDHGHDGCRCGCGPR